MNRLDWIEKTLREALAPDYIEVIDDSDLHRGHAGAEGGGGHYQVEIVAESFRGLSRVERHRAVYDALGEAMRKQIHALAIKAKAPGE